MCRKPKIYWILWPFSVMYRIGVSTRNKLFDWGVLRSRSFPVPLICIGNLAVGGTGKTPHTEYLIRLLQDKFKVATLSRGYRRQTKGFVLASGSATAKDIGDEPLQIFRKFPGVTVAVDANRCRGIARLIDRNTNPNIDVILLDDAFQHRYVKPGISILLTDYSRPFYQDMTLPAGRLREPASGKTRADIVVVTKCPRDLSEKEQAFIRKRLRLSPNQGLFFTTMEYGKLHPLFADMPERSIESLEKGEEVLLLTGIASPEPLVRTLKAHCTSIHPLTFPDHHAFNGNDMQKLEQAFSRLPEGKRLIVTTEKDAARLADHPCLSKTLKPYIYTLPIEVKFLNSGELIFNPKIIEYVRKNSRNRSLYQG